MKINIHSSVFAKLVITSFSVVIIYSNPVAAAGEIEFKATIKAECNINISPIVDLGEIPVTEFSNKSAGQEVSGYDKSFNIGTQCTGTNKYKLTMMPAKAGSGCLESGSEEIGFCLYDSAGSKINLAVGGTSLERSATVTSETIKVIPARASKAPTVGEHSASMTIEIAPL